MKIVPLSRTKLFVTVCLLSAGVKTSAADNNDWFDRLIPLPKEIRLDGVVTVALKDIAIRVSPGAGQDEHTAAGELATLFGVEVATKAAAGKTEIMVGVLDKNGGIGGTSLAKETARLRALPNADHAYIIRHVDQKTIVLAALDAKGVWNAVRTFRQLVENRIEGGRATIPLPEVTDWPDIAWRGMWDDTFPMEHIAWMASLKMNLVDCLSSLSVDDNGRGIVTNVPSKGPTAVGDQSFPSYCRSIGVHFVPVIIHLSHLKRTGIYEKYPQLIGIGEPEDKRFIPPCAKRPELTMVLADWMEALAARPDVDEVSVWLSEVDHQCQCEECRATGQYVMETRAIVAAYRRAKVRFPHLKLRILSTQGSYPVNNKVLAEIPADIGFVYYDGEKTYDSSKSPMIPFILREAAVDGRAIGVCPQLTVSWAVVCPWSSAQFIRVRMTEFADKKISLFSGYATPNLMLYEFAIAAAAEWSWNAHGRSEREFARAFATRKGLKDVDAFAAWAVLNGAVSWDLYGSGVPFQFIEKFGVADRMLAHHVPPVLGEDMFRYFPAEDRFWTVIAECDSALVYAKRIGEPCFIEETLTVKGYCAMNRELYYIARLLSDENVSTAERRAGLNRHFTLLDSARNETNASLKRWEALFGEGAGEGRFTGTLEISDRMVNLVREAIESVEKGGAE